MTPELLRDYYEAALDNGSELVDEAELLYSNGHRARAYFLAVAAVEEIGKALIAFDALGRNLSDPAVRKRITSAIQDHQQKIVAAVGQWLPSNPTSDQDVKRILNWMLHLRHGREPSMYTDVAHDGSKIQTPSEIVRDTAAADCIRLARDCLVLARHHIAAQVPKQRTRSEDQLFIMKTAELQKMMNTEDFWRYYIAEMKRGRRELSDAFVQYRLNYLLKGRQFGFSRDD